MHHAVPKKPVMTCRSGIDRACAHLEISAVQPRRDRPGHGKILECQFRSHGLVDAEKVGLSVLGSRLRFQAAMNSTAPSATARTADCIGFGMDRGLQRRCVGLELGCLQAAPAMSCGVRRVAESRPNSTFILVQCDAESGRSVWASGWRMAPFSGMLNTRDPTAPARAAEPRHPEFRTPDSRRGAASKLRSAGPT